MELIVKAPAYLAEKNKHTEAQMRQVDFVLVIAVLEIGHTLSRRNKSY